MPVRKPDYFAEELFVYVPENCRRDKGKLILAVGEVKAFYDSFQDLVIHRDSERERIRGFVPVRLLLEMKKPGIVFIIGVAEELTQPSVDSLAFQKFVECLIFLNAAILANTEEENPVDGPLHDAVQFVDGQGWIAQGDIFRKSIPPLFYLCKNIVVDTRGSPLAFRGFGIFVERSQLDAFR